MDRGLKGLCGRLGGALGMGLLVAGAWLGHVAGVRAQAGVSSGAAGGLGDWSVYNGHVSGDHFSALGQITTANVAQLKLVWRYEAGVDGGIQTNPLVVGGLLYGYSSTSQVFAVDGATGKEKWRFDPGIVGRQPSRGMTLWTDGDESRLFVYVTNFVYALDPATGKTITDFGEAGRLDLRKDLDSDYLQNTVALTTPGVLYANLLIVGFRAPEAKPAPHGDVRAYDVRTGKLVWSFHTIPHPGEEGYKTWPEGAWKDAGAANNWAGMAVDAVRGIVFVPTGSAVSDFYGADRVGDDLFANSLIALDAKTGKKLWHFQDVHHDIWDRDFPSPPVLVTVLRDGKMVDAVAQTTKHGFIFVFDRVTGKSLFPIEERAFPASDVPGEITSPTQPVPVAPEPYARQRLTAGMLTVRTPEAHAWAVEQFKTLRSGGQFLPFAVDRQTVVFPGFDGGAEWGGSAVDARAGVLYVNANDVPWTGGLTQNEGGSTGAQVYQTQCAGCHGANLEGNPPAFPALVGVEKRLTEAQIVETIHGGKGRMPGFPALKDGRLDDLLGYLRAGAVDMSAVAADTGGKDVAGGKLYRLNCAVCHGENRRGNGPFPSVVGVRGRLTDAEFLGRIHNGRGQMPAFPQLTDASNAAILRFLGSAVPPEKLELAGKQGSGVRYRFTGYKRFLDPEGYPAVVPPWGTLQAIDLNNGRYLWKVPLGEYPELVAKGLRDTGSENYGGPILTAGGVLFIGATIYDDKLRAFDAKTGKLLWEGALPFAGTATPSTYLVDGKQYVVIAASGARNAKGPQGAAYVAFALP